MNTKDYWMLRLNKIKTFFNTALITFLLFTASKGISQDIVVSKTYPTDFRPPMDIPPSLSGSFGEVRSNHFHSGLDYRTNQREGYPVYAVSDGYISRLRVQIGGFGNAVYITHPNGYTSVYAHLQRFNERISQLILDYQYRKQSFDVDFPLLPIEIPVKKGEIIAWSGNTGSSGGPHLHFEIRDSQTEETINPQLFGFDIPDKVKPQITGLYVYHLNKLPFNPHTARQYFPLSGVNGNYTLKTPLINVSGETGFGIITFDQHLAGGNKNGVYSIELQLDNQTIYLSVLERFAFHNSRAINSHIDFPALLLNRQTIQKSFIEPGNPLKIYKKDVNSGRIILKDDKVHEVKYIVKDVKGNVCTLKFGIKNNPVMSVATPQKTNRVKPFHYNQENEYLNQNLRVFLPKGILYSDIDFNYSKSPKPTAYSDLHNIHTRLTPIHDVFSLWIRPDKAIPAHLRDKALIVSSNGVSVGGSYDPVDGFVKANPKAFGSYYVTLDTIAPVIRPLNIAEEKSMAGIAKISLKISDNLSGIQSFNGYIDGQWVLMEYDLKTSSLWHTFDYRTSPGKHQFQLIVTDRKGNSKTYTASFYR